MVDQVLRYVIPQALSLLPPAMDSPAARAMLLAIGLQESEFLYRFQGAQTSSRKDDGPAGGFWMFEPAGVRACLHHRHVQGPIIEAAAALRYPNLRDADPEFIVAVLDDNDVLACVFARCLLWTHAHDLPANGEQDEGWRQYVELWRPGRPRRAVWPGNFAEAWNRERLHAAALVRA